MLLGVTKWHLTVLLASYIPIQYYAWHKWHCHLVLILQTPSMYHSLRVTPIDSIVTAVVNHTWWTCIPRKGWSRMNSSVYTSVNLRVVNGQQLKFNTVNSQSPRNQHGQWSNIKEELVKVLTCGRSCDYWVYGSDSPLPLFLSMYNNWSMIHHSIVQC